MNILVTALGSMSAEHITMRLHQCGHQVIGCDIHPAAWIYSARRVVSFHQIPPATRQDDFLNAVLALCEQHNIERIVPLTDPEVDVLTAHRTRFPSTIANALLHAQASERCRDKWAWRALFANDPAITPIPGYLLADYPHGEFAFPLILKPRTGRSSEGICQIDSPQALANAVAARQPDAWLLQPKINGEVVTVDVVYQASCDRWAAVARRELIRTVNGAGLTVEMLDDPALLEQAATVAQRLGINGCINIEFIRHPGGYGLMDINPRFSAGVEFSAMAGYDMVSNHLRCFSDEPIDAQPRYANTIFTRRYVTVLQDND